LSILRKFCVAVFFFFFFFAFRAPVIDLGLF
jgi:hypothetical protein